MPLQQWCIPFARRKGGGGGARGLVESVGSQSLKSRWKREARTDVGRFRTYRECRDTNSLLLPCRAWQPNCSEIKAYIEWLSSSCEH